MYEAQIQADLEYVEALIFELLRIKSRPTGAVNAEAETETLN